MTGTDTHRGTLRSGDTHLLAQARVRALATRPTGPFRVMTAAPVPARPASPARPDFPHL